ncbi:2-iminobutanoate/2-iminopropanoate deaminase [Hypsizygus marmoreus]|uniref:2-iminobutanoate/2-iminopropanoate deaminase n=1 Tax=Hypsizygus marmoreus TaxID=39966 RepID=A0A369K3S2_HYPMA|nr:2-iminobutanoate/2-iminopropanoate deaminase [Hypsizygus marmoreus]
MRFSSFAFAAALMLPTLASPVTLTSSDSEPTSSSLCSSTEDSTSLLPSTIASTTIPSATSESTSVSSSSPTSSSSATPTLSSTILTSVIPSSTSSTSIVTSTPSESATTPSTSFTSCLTSSTSVLSSTTSHATWSRTSTLSTRLSTTALPSTTSRATWSRTSTLSTRLSTSVPPSVTSRSPSSSSSRPGPTATPGTNQPLTVIRTQYPSIPGSPVSEAIVSDGYIHVSGFLPVELHTSRIVGPDDVIVQTQVVLENLRTIIEFVGSDIEKVVKVTLSLRNTNDSGTVNDAYTEFFETYPPTLSTVAASDIPVGVFVKLDATVRV